MEVKAKVEVENKNGDGKNDLDDKYPDKLINGSIGGNTSDRNHDKEKTTAVFEKVVQDVDM